MNKIFKKIKDSQKGFVILFTVLISTIILMIGFGIFSIATRETILSSTSREAQYSFYAADAGVECALYFQTHTSALNDDVGFAGSSQNSGQVPTCGSASNINGSGIQGNYGDPFQFDILVDPVQKTCAHVTVYDQDSSTRRIISEGYNICNLVNGIPTPATTNPILVERVLDTTFSLVPANQLTGSATTPPVVNGN